MKRNLMSLMVLSCVFAFVLASCMDVHKMDRVCEDCASCTDADGDGYCSVATGGEDCNDSDASVHPGAEEICGDSIDQDCNGSDLACDCTDADEDGFCSEADGGDDCDDSDPDVNPDAVEICDDLIDNDCDGAVDEEDSECDPDCVDADGDGYCSVESGGTDCDDRRAGVHPGATEVCDNGRDDDCDGLVDECGCTDADADGYCASGDDRDCDDSRADIYPGAPELCDGRDNDCDGAVDEGGVCGCDDCDGDGYDAISSGGNDCDDTRASVHPGATEICDNGRDDDCDGSVDEGCTPAIETNCSNGVDDDDDGYTDCDDPDCYGLSGCPSPGVKACYRFTFNVPGGQEASTIRVDGSSCPPGHYCSGWMAPLTDSEGNQAEEFNSSQLRKTLKFIDGTSFELNVEYYLLGEEYWHCSYGGDSSPPTTGDPLFGTLTIERTTAEDCDGGWSVLSTDWVDLGPGLSDCNIVTL